MIFPDVDFHWFPLTNPGIVTVPFSFLCGYLATVVSRRQADPANSRRWRSGPSPASDRG